jgi:hypothetical protein
MSTQETIQKIMMNGFSKLEAEILLRKSQAVTNIIFPEKLIVVNK